MPKKKKGVSKTAFTCGWYDFDKHQVCFSYWKNNIRMARRFDFEWYFFMLRKDAEEISGRVFDSYVSKVEPFGDYVKVFMPYYSDERKELLEWLDKNGVQSFEGDVNPVDRFIFDNEVQISTNPRILFYDIETDTSDGGWDDIERHRILSVSYGSTVDDVQCIVASSFDNKGEKKLLDEFFDVVANYDLLVAWNSAAYDEIVLKARAKRHRVFVNWRTVNFLDFMKLFKRYYMRDSTGSGVRISFSLDNICKTVLGKGKVEDVPVHKMKEFFIENREKAIEYNNTDVIRLIELENKMHYIQAQTILAKLCNRFISDRALMASVLVDGFVLEYASKIAKMHFRTKQYYKEDEEPKEQIEGAFVMDPVLGMHEGICDLDFASLYPSIVIAFNISPETKQLSSQKIGENGSLAQAANGVYFRNDKKGIFPIISQIALLRRKEYKDDAARLEREGKEGSLDHQLAKQTSDAWKVLANSMYGVMASNYGRYGDRDCGEAITITGKYIIQRVIKLSESKGIPVIYGDTDSTFNKCSNAVAIEFADIARKDVNGWLRERGAKEDMIRLKLDAEFERIFFTSKKRYAGKKTTGKWDIRGLELIRSDGCKYMREMQRRIITYLLESESPNAKMAKRIVEKWAYKLFSRQVGADDLKLAQSLGRPISQYVGDTVHVRIAKELLKQGKEVFVGMKVPYVVIGKKDGKLDAVHVDDFDGNYDAKLYWKNKIYPPTQRILEVCFPDFAFDWIRLFEYQIGGAKQRDIFDSEKVKRTVEIRLLENDKPHLESLKSVCDKYPGEHPLSLRVVIPDNEVLLSTDTRVRFIPSLVVEMEKIVGHRVYYGKEEWD